MTFPRLLVSSGASRLGAVLWLAAAIAAGAPRPAAAAAPDMDTLNQLNAEASDTSRAAAAIPGLRQILAGDLDDNYVPVVRQVLLRAMINSRQPALALVAAADTLGSVLGQDQSVPRVLAYGQVAEVLVERNEELGHGEALAQKAIDACPEDSQYDGVRAACRTLLGRAQLGQGKAEAAIATFSRAVPAAPDSQNALRYLGDAYAKRGRADDAIDAYVRSLAVFPAQDTAAAAVLRGLYAKRHGSLKGLDQRIEAASKASRDRVALEARRHEQPAPTWKLANFSGSTVQLEDFKGKVLVVDFWGSWCGPCRAELPTFQAMYDRYKGRGVAFVGINWERDKTVEAKREAARKFMEQSGYTFPVVMDQDYAVSTAYSVEAFPTVFLIDKTGKIRYRNVGLSQGIDRILEAQIQSLMAEAQPGQ